ncbi:Sulfur carrier protein ThiS [archaeon HR01]|nr:Sulfur carrier protein ThiS [archaeon HR01]
MSELGVVKVNGRDMACAGKTVSEVLESVGVNPAQHGVAVAVNGEIVSRNEWGLIRLKAGDVVEVVTAVAGG